MPIGLAPFGTVPFPHPHIAEIAVAHREVVLVFRIGWVVIYQSLPDVETILIGPACLVKIALLHQSSPNFSWLVDRSRWYSALVG